MALGVYTLIKQKNDYVERRLACYSQISMYVHVLVYSNHCIQAYTHFVFWITYVCGYDVIATYVDSILHSHGA